jgi:SAM-dependent methyltransferase
MKSPELSSQIDAATAYENFFVPALFRQWAPRVVAAGRIQPGQRVLDVACGTGVLSRAAAQAVSPTGAVTGVDCNPGMLEVARRLAPTVEWHHGRAERLPFPGDAFDAVLSQFGLMFFEDRAAALREMWRVVRPGGRIVVAVWAALEDTPAYATVVSLLDRLAGPDAAAALRAPFVLGARGELASPFSMAGIPNVAISTHTGAARFPSIRAMVEADLRGWLPLVGVSLTEDVIETVLQEASAALGSYVIEDGTVQFAIPAHIATVERPPR